MSDRTETGFIVFHCSASPPNQPVRGREIRQLHTAPKTDRFIWGPYTLSGKAWRDIGYHFVIPRDGAIELGRDIEAIGAHVKGYNSVSVSVCLVGGIDETGKPEDNFTAEQWRAADLLLALLRARYPQAKWLGHRDLSPDANGDGVITRADWLKACPSFDVRARWPIT